jgi:hypothetical protein
VVIVSQAAKTRKVRGQASRMVYIIANLAGAAENKLIGAQLNAGSGHQLSASRALHLNLPQEQVRAPQGVPAAEAFTSSSTSGAPDFTRR